MLTYVLAALQRWCQYQLTVSELSQLSDRELSDLGIARCDIGNIARDAVALQ